MEVGSEVGSALISALGSGIDGIGAGGSRRQWWDRDQVDIRLDITCRQTGRQTAKCAPRVAQHKRAVSTALVTALVTTSTTDHTRQVWRDYHKHAFARRCYADPSDANLAEQHRARKQHEDERTEREELALARTFLAWRRGMG